ncbi:MAG: hypothetical protein LBK12_00970 [Odoribacteraceae bacterium]|jgi:hypothetical protein|nr:hypothetical protein [Odoribacteraceae bacterium]
MFCVRFNKIKVFNNYEGFLGLFNRAEMRIHGLASGDASRVARVLTVADLLELPDESSRVQRLLDAVLAGGREFVQSCSLAIDGVKDNQSMTFGESGLVIYRSELIPSTLDVQIWVIESDEDIRRFALDADEVLDSDAFKGLLTAATAALSLTNPLLTGAIAVGGVTANLLRKKLRANKDDLVGYWQCSLTRAEHYPHGVRDRQDIPDTTGNMLVDYTLFGYENEV